MAFRSATEDWLATHGPKETGTWTPQNISPQLREDLKDLDLTPLSVSPIKWAPQVSESFGMGVHYVLEGSALGARILCKQVAALGLHRDHGARHLWAQADTLENWRGYLSLLSAHTVDEDALIAGANAAFDAAAGAMERAANV